MQGLNALVCFDRDVLYKPLAAAIAPGRSTRPPGPLTVLTQAKVQRLLAAMTGRHAPMAGRFSGGGLRLLEPLRLRLQEVERGQGRICVQSGTDRTVLRPRNWWDAWPAQVEVVQARHHQDRDKGCGEVYLHEALAMQFPKALRKTGWPWVFPARERPLDPRSTRAMRHHGRASGLPKAVTRAAAQAMLDKKVGYLTQGHSVATHRLAHGVNIRVLQARRGHDKVRWSGYRPDRRAGRSAAGPPPIVLIRPFQKT